MPSPSKSFLERVFGTQQQKLAHNIGVRRTQEEGKRKFGIRPLGEEDAEGIMNPGVGPTMAITKYLKEGRPDVFGRMVGTEKFKILMNRMGMGESGAEFAKRYPRIAAHMNMGSMPDVPSTEGKRGLAFTGHDIGPSKPTVDVFLNPRELSGTKEISQTLAHEGTHVAQRLGLGDKMHPRYQLANENLGYDLNPFEMSARNAANRYVYGRDIIPPVTVSSLSESMIDMAKNQNQMSIPEYIKSIFTRRDPGVYSLKNPRPSRGFNDTSVGKFTDEEVEIIKNRKESMKPFKHLSVRDRQPIRELMQWNPDLHTTQELNIWSPLSNRGGDLESIEEMVNAIKRNQ